MASELPHPALATVEGWGMSSRARATLVQPRSAEDIAALFRTAESEGRTIAFRGSGCSYGDAAINDGGYVVDLRRFARILSFDEGRGILRAEPGLTIESLWRFALPKGFWPPVVPGTMFPTLGGSLAMNIHGKNNFQAGTIGEHVLDFDLLLPDGSSLHCSRDENPEVFFAAIGGFGMLGCFTAISLKLKRVHSGDLRVRPIATDTVREMIEVFESEHARSDYLVGWLDVIGGGRGLIHQAWYLKDGEDASPRKTLDPAHQDLPKRFFFAIPKSWLWTGLWFFLNPLGMKLVNATKFRFGRRHAKHPPYRQPLVGFSFLLDYVPNWKYAYKPGGLIQYQTFVPKAEAARVFGEQIRLCREARVYPYLGVLKKHRPDPFLMTHAVDGYSLAMDFPVNRRTRERVVALARRMDAVVAAAGGRFYLAKDSLMTAELFRRVYPAEKLERFLELKRRLDPALRLRSELSRRLLEPLLGPLAVTPR